MAADKRVQAAMRRVLIVLILALLPAANAGAGLYYSGEKYAELPSEWKGLLADARALRGVAAPSLPGQPSSTLKRQYEAAARALRDQAKQRELTADEAADLGAVLLRLGKTGEALGLLRAAHQMHPEHFALAANLGTAWQLQGDLRQAVEHLRLAVALAPAAQRPAEALHLRLVQRRLRDSPAAQALDDLFDRAKEGPLPTEALPLVQQLLIWFPADGRLVWQLGELADRLGDKRGAAELLELAVGEFGVNDPALRRRRAETRAAYLEELKQPLVGLSDQKALHQGHVASAVISFKSRRPLLQRRFDYQSLGAARRDAVNPLPWGLLLETNLSRQGQPTFPHPIKELDNLRVELVGYMQPIGDDPETSLFLLVEQPVGCWYCELPEPTGIVCVELKEGKTIEVTRDPVKIIGKLKLNRDDPEDFFFLVTDAEVGVPD
jgi:hypothetical protein